MTSRFHTTNNSKWFAVRRPPGLAGSERMLLYEWISLKPGISSGELEEKWDFETSMRSRLKELADAGYIRFEREVDLFNE